MSYNTGCHTVFHHRYHIVWTPKYRYKVLTGALRKRIWIRGYVGEVVIGCKAEIIARHTRSYDNDDMIFNPLHYLPLIERKIASLDQAAPLEGWALPEELITLRVISALDQIIEWRGKPSTIRCDNGPEYISHLLV